MALLAPFLIFVRADAASGRAADTLKVCPSGGALYTTIQAAVEKAKSGDRIEVCADTFAEQIVIKESVKLFGAGPGKTKIAAPPSRTGNIVEIAGSSADVELSGFTIAGPGPTNCGGLLSGVFVRDGAHASIHDNNIKDVRDDPFSGCQNGVGIRVGWVASSTSGTATITDNTITGYQKAGIFVDGPGSDARVTGNTLKGAGPTGVIAQNGIEVLRGASAKVTRNTVSANSYSPADTEATGILLYGDLGATSISHNTLVGNEFGIEAFRTAPSGGAITISDNTIKGGDRGISLGGETGFPTKELLIETNAITGAELFGVNADNDTSGNTFRGNDASAKHFDCRDASKGDKTGHTANKWTENTGSTAEPDAICSPPKLSVDTPPVIVLPPSGQQPATSTEPPSGTQPPSPPAQPPSPPAQTPAPPPTGKPQPAGEREAITLGNEMIARMKNRMLKSCTITLSARGSQKTLLARGLAGAPPGGKGQLVVRVGLVPRGEQVLSNLVGGAIVDVRAVCRTTSNKTGQRIKTARAVLQIEHTTTPSGSWVPDKAILTPAGQRFLKSLAKRMVAATRIRCDGHTAAWAASPVDATALSRARARLVCARLRRKGVVVEISVVPHGNASPIATNTTEAGRAINRRVGVSIVHPIAVRSPRSKH
jgi:outer membrane protein OmpA-like peptidoglycan-associated protein/nitrous oxidase accessory protein NosD